MNITTILKIKRWALRNLSFLPYVGIHDCRQRWFQFEKPCLVTLIRDLWRRADWAQRSLRIPALQLKSSTLQLIAGCRTPVGLD
jgi:hypothetical protein